VRFRAPVFFDLFRIQTLTLNNMGHNESQECVRPPRFVIRIQTLFRGKSKEIISMEQTYEESKLRTGTITEALTCIEGCGIYL
jgi:hypothetical protein